MAPDVGPSRERLTSPPDLDEQFARTVGAVTDGEMTFPVPFDLRSAAALAANDSSGAYAIKLFNFLRSVSTPRYRIQFTELAGDDAVVERALIDCVLDNPVVAAALVGHLAQQLTKDSEGK
jgi:hypothetical protein